MSSSAAARQPFIHDTRASFIFSFYPDDEFKEFHRPTSLPAVRGGCAYRSLACANFCRWSAKYGDVFSAVTARVILDDSGLVFRLSRWLGEVCALTARDFLAGAQLGLVPHVVLAASLFGALASGPLRHPLRQRCLAVYCMLADWQLPVHEKSSKTKRAPVHDCLREMFALLGSVLGINFVIAPAKRHSCRVILRMLPPDVHEVVLDERWRSPVRSQWLHQVRNATLGSVDAESMVYVGIHALTRQWYIGKTRVSRRFARRTAAGFPTRI
jgi:hypothetical protein